MARDRGFALFSFDARGRHLSGCSSASPSISQRHFPRQVQATELEETQPMSDSALVQGLLFPHSSESGPDYIAQRSRATTKLPGLVSFVRKHGGAFPADRQRRAASCFLRARDEAQADDFPATWKRFGLEGVVDKS